MGDRFRWQLAVCDGDVTASRHFPGEPSIYYTTADFGLTARDPGADDLSLARVLAAYQRESDCKASVETLLERVHDVLTSDGQPESTPVGQPA